MYRRVPAVLAATLSALFLASCGSGGNDVASNDKQPPNILFVVLDDLGVDQLSAFGYGGVIQEGIPKTSTINAVAQAGVTFRNAWSMPTCTTTRATFFNGRYPFRSNIKNAVVSTDLANSQLSPFEITTPKLLKEKGYVNALIGKMHLVGSDRNPDNNPLGNGAMRELGWDYFAGYLDGAPYPIDTTAGGANHANNAHYGCGFVPTLAADPTHGADTGACYQPSGECTDISTQEESIPGLACVAGGGLFDPGQSCHASAPSYLDFTEQNGYYTSELVINHADGTVQVFPPEHARGRGYRTIMETDLAVDWITQQPSDKPWMASVGYSAIHTPLQPPPVSLLPDAAAQIDAYTCTNDAENEGSLLAQRELTTHMIEALDTEIGRLMVETGLAKYRADGALDYRPQETNTVVVIMADNGTYGPSVKFPFSLTRAKGSPYQTGVWVPLVVAGPMVKEPGREVPHMVNSADMYALFSEVAGIDLAQALPETRQVDAQPVLAYLTEPSQTSIRSTNYTEMGTNIASVKADPPSPCVIPAFNMCVQIFPQAGVCADQSGVWYGPGGVAGAEGLESCCAVNEYLVNQGDDPVDLLPNSQRAVRNESFKLVQLERLNCASNEVESSEEFYAINQNVPLPLLDRENLDLLQPPHHMTPEMQQNYQALTTEMDTLLASHIDCPGDGNLDLVVDEQDVENWKYFSTHNGGHSSWYDFNHDGLTNEADLAIINQNMRRDCRPAS
ncbi:sulfatase-like hydrolase/transferase [Pusillimonas sp.]|uniref:sulfatase-like hydrolase/transferase n=1 Tax=Pusillimonas sp. TaxID=3040095 RepID=UPI0037C8E8D2